MNNESRIKAVQEEIQLLENILEKDNEDDFNIYFSRKNRLKELKRTKTQLECVHIEYRFDNVANRKVTNEFCPKCGRSLMIG